MVQLAYPIGPSGRQVQSRFSLLMVEYMEEMRNEVKQFNWVRRKTAAEKERNHLLKKMLRIWRSSCSKRQK